MPGVTVTAWELTSPRVAGAGLIPFFKEKQLPQTRGLLWDQIGRKNLILPHPS